MYVKILSQTSNMENLIAAAAKLCYTDSSIDDILKNLTSNNVEKFIDRLASYGHMSPFEHASISFGVEGVSRALTHQLVRHRIASYSQQSQRYVVIDKFEFVTPPAIADLPSANKEYQLAMNYAMKKYTKVFRLLKDEYLRNGVKEKDADKLAAEDARYLYPNAVCTKIVVTMNLRSLYNFFKHRCCERAQWEIRDLADSMLKLCVHKHKLLFSKCGPDCAYGKCNEGAMTCGKMITIRNKYKRITQPNAPVSKEIDFVVNNRPITQIKASMSDVNITDMSQEELKDYIQDVEKNGYLFQGYRYRSESVDQFIKFLKSKIK